MTQITSTRWTRAALDALPDDGTRHEIIDGELYVSPTPPVLHQIVLGNLHLLLRASSPATYRVLPAPLDVALADDTVMQPDLLIADRGAFTERDLPDAPLVAIEVLAPSTRRLDLTIKKDRLQRAGTRLYWVVDPDAPSVTVWTLINGRYAQTGYASGTDTLHLTEPFPLDLTPVGLLA